MLPRLKVSTRQPTRPGSSWTCNPDSVSPWALHVLIRSAPAWHLVCDRVCKRCPCMCLCGASLYETTKMLPESLLKIHLWMSLSKLCFCPGGLQNTRSCEHSADSAALSPNAFYHRASKPAG